MYPLLMGGKFLPKKPKLFFLEKHIPHQKKSYNFFLHFFSNNIFPKKAAHLAAIFLSLIITTFLHIHPVSFNPLDCADRGLHSVPETHEGKPKEQTKSAAKLCHVRGRGVEDCFCLYPRVRSDGEETNPAVIFIQFDHSCVDVNNLVFLVITRLYATCDIPNFS